MAHVSQSIVRLIHLTVPFGLALACAGAALMIAAKGPHSDDPLAGTQVVVRHTVTPQMTIDTAKESKTQAPAMTAKDTTGKSLTLGSTSAPRPQFVYFVLDGCPCSYEAEPMFHKLQAQFQGKVDFVSVTDADAEKAAHWAKEMDVKYPVISDPDKKIIHAYHAKASVYSALLDEKGSIVQMWPGYSAGLLTEMNHQMSVTAHVPERPFDTEFAPTVKATGCAF